MPLMGGAAAAGFPSPAEDYIEGSLDLNEHLVPNPPATFFVRAAGRSMEGVGIFDGDLLIVDRSLTPASGCIAIVATDGELAVKRLRLRDGRAFLASENPDYPDIPVDDEADLRVWGVYKHVIHRL